MNRGLYFFVIGLFLLLLGPALFSQGMFLDGLMYAAIGRNLADGEGSWWALYYTKELYPYFKEHPPLAFWLQSFFYRIFGDHEWVERFYSLACISIVFYLIHKTWRLISRGLVKSWLPLLYFALIPLVSWSGANNMLENTMMVFTTLSLHLYLLALNRDKNVLIVVAGSVLTLAFLAKGPTGLFVLVLPFTYQVCRADYRKAFVDQVLFTIGFGFFTGLLFLFPESKQNLMDYYYRQVEGSIENVVTVESRAYIVYKSFTELLIPLGLIIALAAWQKWKNKQMVSILFDSTSLSLIFVAYAGVLPIMVSMKQSGFYMLCTFPFFVLALARMSEAVIIDFIRGWSERPVKIVGALVLIVAIGVSAFCSTLVGRDQEKLAMLSVFEMHWENKSTVHIQKHDWTDWNLHAYFMRKYRISLSHSAMESGDLMLSKGKIATPGFVKVDQTKGFYLYRYQ